jgi:hypothetical protein
MNLSFENFIGIRIPLSWGKDAQIPGPKSSKFCTLAPNICGPQCGTCFVSTFLAPRILRWLLEFCKILVSPPPLPIWYVTPLFLPRNCRNCQHRRSALFLSCWGVEDGVRFLRNVDKFVSDHTTSHPRRSLSYLSFMLQVCVA